MRPPPRDANGNVIPHDHCEISDDDGVIRRISEQQIVPDLTTGRWRVSSLAFQGSSEPDRGMSVDIEKLIADDGLDPREYVTTPRWMGSVWFRTRDLRSEQLKVGFDPIEDVNPYHGQVWGKFPKSKSRRLLALAIWFVEIPDVSISPG